MGEWTFVFLAYGIVWSAILVYVLSLNLRLKRAEAEKSLIAELERSPNDA